MSQRNLFLIGPAGNGKSFTTKVIILQAMKFYLDLDALITCAPTHVAAKGYQEGRTLQSFLGKFEINLYIQFCFTNKYPFGFSINTSARNQIQKNE